MKPVAIPLVTLWDYFGQHTFGMAQYFRGLQGDGSGLVFEQHICKAKLGRQLPSSVDTILRQVFALKNHSLLKQVQGKPWVLGGQQFVHLIPKKYLQTATVVVYDLLNLDYPNTMSSSRSCDLLKTKLEYMRYANQIITISHFSKQRVIAHFNVDPNRIAVVPIGIDTEKFHPVSKQRKEEIRERLGVPVSAFVILYVGSEQRRKNLLSLAKGLTRLAEAVPDLLFVKVGRPQSSISSKQFRAFLKESGLIKNSLLIDYAEDLEDWYAIADIFAFPSVAEGFGIPLLEAMACELPVVTTKLSSIPEVVGDVALAVEDPYDPLAWRHAITELIRSPEKCQEMSKQGRQRAIKFSWDTYRKEFIQVVSK